MPLITNSELEKSENSIQHEAWSPCAQKSPVFSDRCETVKYRK